MRSPYSEDELENDGDPGYGTQVVPALAGPPESEGEGKQGPWAGGAQERQEIAPPAVPRAQAAPKKEAGPAVSAWKLGLERRQLSKPNLARPSPQKAGNALAEARVLGLDLGKQRLISHGLSLVLCT